jgi:hypothetical protein
MFRFQSQLREHIGSMKSFRISAASCCVAIISLWYWIAAGLIAMDRPFWFDELVTWHVARLPTLGGIWTALHSGVDQSLPFTHLPVRWSHAIFGYGTLATRLPALVGFWVMLLGVYAFLKSRLPTPYALIGMVFPMLTYAWAYAFEARAYGIILGGAGLALASWQAATEGRRRSRSLIGIALGLAVALASNYSAVLLAVPFALGEAVRTFDRRKLDLPIWISFAASALVTLMYPGLLASTRDWDLHGMQPGVTDYSGFYATAVKSVITPLLLAGVAAYILVRNPKDQQPPVLAFPRHEIAALVGFALAPMLFIAAGMVSHHMVFWPRYGVICVIGLAGCSAALIFRATAGNSRAGVVMLVVLVGWLAAARGRDVLRGIGDPRVVFQQENPVLVQAVQAGMPVLVPDALAFIAADFYLPGGVLGQIHYPLPPPDEHDKADFNDQLMAAAARGLPIHVRVDSWSALAALRQPFLLYLDEHPTPWICDHLLRTGWRLSLRAQEGRESLFEVTPPL